MKYMMNKLKKSYAGLVTQTTQAVAGLDLYAAEIGVLLVNRSAMNDKLVAYIAGGNASTHEKATLSARRTALRSIAKTAYDYLGTARDVLKPGLGRQYSPAWNEVGFTGSLKVPRNEEKTIQYLQAMVAFFTVHPDLENTALNVTAARTLAILNALTAARNEVNSQMTALQLTLSNRNSDSRDLRNMLKALLKELGLKLHPTDERWTSFGFNKPGVRSTPAVPEAPIVTLVSPTSAALNWKKTARAERFRVYKKVVGIDPEIVLVETREELDFLMDGLPPGATIQLAITAVNNGGESQLSETVSIATP